MHIRGANSEINHFLESMIVVAVVLIPLALYGFAVGTLDLMMIVAGKVIKISLKAPYRKSS